MNLSQMDLQQSQYVTKARYTKDVDYYATVDGEAVESRA